MESIENLKAEITKKFRGADSGGKNADVMIGETLGRMSSGSRRGSFENTLDCESPNMTPREMLKASTLRSRGEAAGPAQTPLKSLLSNENVSNSKKPGVTIMDHTNIVVDRTKWVKSPAAKDRRKWIKEGPRSQ